MVPYFKNEKIADRSYMISNAFTPSTPALCYLITGDDYALLIDTIMGWGDLKAYCESITDKPIRVINIHAHFDTLAATSTSTSALCIIRISRTSWGRSATPRSRSSIWRRRPLWMSIRTG
ncbi:MAG: hypothetical protein IKR73_06330 [Oscillospiraceae bacterium]|nr:hypothetical protein [Oscillospiraceae bacterium]